jgi:4-amino-4-deoxy-L-arabinose transferase-like glycosyltransferase
LSGIRRLPRAGLVCALVACLNAVCWSLVSPPFEVPDEPDHFAYVKQLAETASLPTSSGGLGQEEIAALTALHEFNIRQQPQTHTIASQSEQEGLERQLAATVREQGSSAAGLATSEPPLYYALEAIPYSIAENGTVLERLALMRLTSALFAAVTALFAFLFLREALPGAPWAWTVGGLAVALAPLLGQMSGAVSPDAMLFAVSAAIFYCLARAFRRGLSARTTVAVAALTLVGLLTKVNFIGVVPGVLLGVLVLVIRAARVSRRAAWRLLGLALALGLGCALAYAGVNILFGRAALGVAAAAGTAAHGSLPAELNYIWQLYLPRLPGTVNDFPDVFTTRQLWFDGYVGLYGWLDAPFPGWLYDAALIPAAAIALLCARALCQRRGVLRRRAGELAVYAAIALGLLVVIGAASYTAFPGTDAEYAQTRYLLPLLPLLGAVIALAARGAGRRWGPIVGVLLVVMFLGQDIFSQLQVVARYYG